MGSSSAIRYQRQAARWGTSRIAITDRAHAVEKHVGRWDGNARGMGRVITNPVGGGGSVDRWNNAGWAAGGPLLRHVGRNGVPSRGVFCLTERCAREQVEAEGIARVRS